MPFEDETVWDEAGEVARAAANFKDPGTAPALEVMMVTAPRLLVARGVARKFDRVQPAAFHQRVDGAVHRGDAKSLKRPPASDQNLKRTEGLLGAGEDVANRISLSCIAFHGRHLPDRGTGVKNCSLGLLP